jgi:hypothetical protein
LVSTVDPLIHAISTLLEQDNLEGPPAQDEYFNQDSVFVEQQAFQGMLQRRPTMVA